MGFHAFPLSFPQSASRPIFGGEPSRTPVIHAYFCCGGSSRLLIHAYSCHNRCKSGTSVTVPRATRRASAGHSCWGAFKTRVRALGPCRATGGSTEEGRSEERRV